MGVMEQDVKNRSTVDYAMVTLITNNFSTQCAAGAMEDTKIQ